MPTILDLRQTKCPLNFVKAKLAAEKLQVGETLELCLLAGSESVLNVPNSLRKEGFWVEELLTQEPDTIQLRIKKTSC
jgi:TusA-related sulfurtransferase